jgi:diguanylate cyclase
MPIAPASDEALVLIPNLRRSFLPLASGLSAAARAALTAAWLFVLLGLVALAAHEAHLLGGHDLDGFFNDGLSVALLAAVTGLTVARAALVRAERWVWIALALALALWTAGELYYVLAIEYATSPPSPSVSDAAWLLFYPPAYAALVLLVRAHVRRFHASVWLDGAIGALAVAALGATLVLEPVIRTTHGSFATVATNLAYPLGDVLLTTFVIGVFALTGWRPGRTWLLIGVSFVMLAVADDIYLFRVASNTYQVGTLLDVLWPAGMTLLAYAAWQRPRERIAPRLEGRAVMVMPALFTLIALFLLIRSNYVHLGVITEVLATGALLLALARMALTFREVQQLADSRRQARTDDLTGLPNRRHLYVQLHEAIEGARTRGASFALLLIDLDRFKEINDTLGHYAGDLLLQQLGPRVQSVLRDGQTLARLGGDEFALILRDADASEAVAKRIGGALQRPFQLDGLSIAIPASIGIAVFPGDAQDADGLMQRADVAMYEAKESHTGYAFYVPDRDIHTPERLALIAELPRAIEQGQLTLEYQPQVDVSTGKVRGVEALVRWQHPVRGRIAPEDFIPIAEHTGFMRELTAAVLDQALEQQRAWIAAGRQLTMAVNISATNLLDATFVVDLRRILERWRTPPHLFQVEITESVLTVDAQHAIAVLNAITALGVGVSLDDFGTGYSSLAYLRQFSVDELKVDRSFVATMLDDPTAATIVASTIELANRLGISVVAEGVETVAELDLLHSFGCQLVQGYYFSKPLSPGDLEQWMDAWAERSGTSGPEVSVSDPPNERRLIVPFA